MPRCLNVSSKKAPFPATSLKLAGDLGSQSLRESVVDRTTGLEGVRAMSFSRRMIIRRRELAQFTMVTHLFCRGDRTTTHSV
jgi:hypothetical protein